MELRVRGTGIDLDPIIAVTADDVTGSNGADDVAIRAELHTVVAVAQVGCAIRSQADDVGKDRGVVRIVQDADTILTVADDHVAMGSGGSSDGVACCTVLQDDPVPAVPDGGGSSEVRADVVADDAVVPRGTAQADARVVVAADDVTCASSAASDGVVGAGAVQVDAIVAVAEIGGARCIGPDEVAHDRIGTGVVQQDAVLAIAADQVALTVGETTDQAVGPFQGDAFVGIRNGGSTCGIGSDAIALNGRVASGHYSGHVATDHVAFVQGAVTADRVADAARVHVHTVESIPDPRGSGRIGADVVADHPAAGDTSAFELHTVAAVARDHVAIRGVRSTDDHVCGGAGHSHTVPAVRRCSSARRVGAEVIARHHHGIAAQADVHATVVETVDDEATHHGVRGVPEGEAVLVHCGGAVQFDDRSARETRLGACIQYQRSCGRWQSRGGRDRCNTNGEGVVGNAKARCCGTVADHEHGMVDACRSTLDHKARVAQVIGLGDQLAQGSLAGVVGVAHHIETEAEVESGEALTIDVHPGQ